jgi:flagellar basal body-associated protein FliL
MGEPKQAEAQPAAPASKGSIVRTLGIVAGLVLTAGIMGVVVWHFVVKPRLTAEVEPPPPPATLQVAVPFDETAVTLIMPQPEMLASLLSYKLTIDCSNQETADLVIKYKPRFVDLIRKSHSYKTRAEMDDPLVEESIRRQIMQSGNALIEEIEGKENPDNRIVAVYHEKFVVQDM